MVSSKLGVVERVKERDIYSRKCVRVFIPLPRTFPSFLLHYINRYVSVLLPRNAVDTEMYTFGVFVGGGVRKMHFLFL